MNAKHLLPRPVRRTIRALVRELPVRVRDLPSDLRDLRSSTPLPPAYLRSRVALTSSRAEFIDVGKAVTSSIIEALRAESIPLDQLQHIVDFGCGSGRVIRHMISAVPHASFVGVDIDQDAIDWCRSHMTGSFHVGSMGPPSPLPSEKFDLLYAVSVFTHFSEELQDAWLTEIRRVLKPGGILIASTHSPSLTFERPDLSSEQHRTLQSRGFLFAPGAGRFNEASAFHSEAYLHEHWSRWFEPSRYIQHGMAGYQDLSVFRRAVRAGESQEGQGR